MDRRQMRERIVAGLLGEEENRLQSLTPERGSITPITDFNKLWSKVELIDARSTDIILPKKNFSVVGGDDNLYLGIPGETLPFSNWSLNQICETADVPASYVKKMMAADEFAFAAKNLNRWLHDLPEDKEYLLRTTNMTQDRLHGFLTDRYSIFDDKEVLDVIHTLLSSQDRKWHLANYMATPELMSARIVADDYINIDGEDLSIAYKFWNSRVGASSLEGEFFIYKWMCGNGMIVGGGKVSVMTQRHVRVNKDMWAQRLNEIVARTPALTAYVKEAVESARVQRLNSESLELLLGQFKEDTKASKASLEIIKGAMERYGGDTKWALANAITEVAQDFSVDTREKYERYAGAIIERKAA